MKADYELLNNIMSMNQRQIQEKDRAAMEKVKEIKEKESALTEERARNQSLAEANNELLRRLRQAEHLNFNSVDSDRAFEDTLQADRT